MIRSLTRSLVASALTAAIDCGPTWTRTNYAGRSVSLAGGLGAVAGIAAAVRGPAGPALAVAAGCGAVAGYIDDHHESDTSIKGLSGHLGALKNGTVTTGSLKIGIIGAGSALAAALIPGRPWLTSTVAIAGSANLVNLLDLRPGRALKASGALAGASLIGSAASRHAGSAVLGTIAGLWPDEVRERTMLGDLGANALGAAAGVAAASTPVLGRVVAVGSTLLILASEKISFSRVIESSEVLSAIDRCGRV